MWTYDVFGRRIESTIELSRLAGARVEPTAADRSVDLVVRQGALPATPDEIDATLETIYECPSDSVTGYRFERTIYWFADGVGTVRVRDGRKITASPAPSATPDAIGRVVGGPGLRSALCQRGNVVVHASAVAIDEQAVAFLGRSGRGKSTAAAACFAHGHDVLTDDAMLVEWRNGAPFVPPGAPRLDIDEAAADALGLGGGGSLDVSSRFSDVPRPLTATIVLEDGETFAVTDLKPRHATFTLLRAADSLYGDRSATAIGSHLEDVGAIASAVRSTRLTRPRSLSRLSELPPLLESTVCS